MTLDCSARLGPRERFVLALLAQAEAPLPRWQLVLALNPRDDDDNLVRVHISHLRDKLGHDAIRTIRGVGYVLTEAGRSALACLEGKAA